MAIERIARGRSRVDVDSASGRRLIPGQFRRFANHAHHHRSPRRSSPSDSLDRGFGAGPALAPRAADHRTSRSTHVIEAIRPGPGSFRACCEDPPDLVLLNLGLPLDAGFEILRALKEDARTCNVPVIVVSATTGTADIVRGLDGGAVDFVTKPYDLFVLQARVRVALRTKRLQELLEQRAHVDGLTGLANRLALEDRLANEWGMLHRHGGSLAAWSPDLDLSRRSTTSTASRPRATRSAASARARYRYVRRSGRPTWRAAARG